MPYQPMLLYMVTDVDIPFAELPDSARRHVHIFQGHQFLDRFAMGIIVAVTALALQGRGLGVGEIGTLFAVYAAIVLTTELPFGGLADGIGRRPVFLLATVASLAASFVFILSDTFWPLSLSFALVGIGRALRSGTLDAWYVEGLREHAPGTELQPLLARAQTANFAGLGVGAIVGGLLPGFVAGNDPTTPLVGHTVYDVSYAAGLVLTVAVIAYTVLLVREPARPLSTAIILREVRAVPATIRDGAQLAASDRSLLLLLTILALMLFATNPVEVLWPTVVQALLDPERAAALVGLVTAGYFLAIAFGASLAGKVSRLFRRRHAVTLAVVLGALILCQIVLALQGSLAGFVGTFLLFSVVLGLSESPAATILHSRVPDGRRSTILSVQSLLKQLGAMAGLLVLGWIGDTEGVGAAWIAGTVGLGAAAALAILLARQTGR
ncbi:MFS transporter [Jannaschia pohangensis]|uniref:Predicted arabinose efflux permease, MFS family n=1 Tax=Jannaschia pohangensis TaxID=390807 RepID=A0A1I3V311_9RHOB|nr:MFS transporter [Jannaschia pohangensis]SFJ89379.1 Predicted arabinose efflux permease, MFS family [Jannaschia pohangensis]